MPIIEAKHAILDAVGGDVDVAATLWADKMGDAVPTRSAVAGVIEELASVSSEDAD